DGFTPTVAVQGVVVELVELVRQAGDDELPAPLVWSGSFPLPVHAHSVDASISPGAGGRSGPPAPMGQAAWHWRAGRLPVPAEIGPPDPHAPSCERACPAPQPGTDPAHALNVDRGGQNDVPRARLGLFFGKTHARLGTSNEGRLMGLRE